MTEFEYYLKQAREDLCEIAQVYTVEEHRPLRTRIDSLLIAYDQAVAKALSIYSVVNWLPFKKENYDQFAEICKKDRCMCLFDDGTECNYNDEHPMAVMTHFREI